MDAILKMLEKVVPLLSEYPLWVRVCVLLWLTVSAAVIGLLLVVPRSAAAPASDGSRPADMPSVPAPADISQQQSGTGNLQAAGDIRVGGDLNIIHQAERTDGLLEITHVGFTHEGEFDVMVRNVGDTDLIIHTITIKKVQSPGIFCLPMLDPTAKYEIRVSGLPVGGESSLSVSHLVPARTADRFLIALHTTSVVQLETTLRYNKDSAALFTEWTWGGPPPGWSPDSQPASESDPASRQRRSVTEG